MNRIRLHLQSFVVVLAFLLAGLFLGPTVAQAQQTDGSVTVPVVPGEVTIDTGEISAAALGADAPATAHFSGPDIQFLAAVGAPALPYHVVQVLLPPDADLTTVRVHLENVRFETVAGNWDVAPMPPPATWRDGEIVVGWPPGKTIVDGRDVAIYGSAAPFPADVVGGVNAGLLRKWALVEVPLAAFQYRPAEGRLERLREVTIVAEYRADPALLTEPGAEARFADTLGDARAAEVAINFAEIAPLYPGPVSAAATSDVGTTYVILTRSSIRDASTELANFVAAKEALGFNVAVVTETSWGGGIGDVAAENIRAWLAANYAPMGMEYVLLIGNPDPIGGDVPMKMLWPRSHDTEYRESPSDYYYADLTGNWNLDGDSLYGETDDFGPGGVDRNWEVLVGRIPYYGNMADLDHILAKSVAYGSEPSDQALWRKNALLPMMRSDEATPGYYLGEAIVNDILEPLGDWGYHRAYEQSFGLIPPPETICDTAPWLCYNNEAKITSVWTAEDFGFVAWWTHGWWGGASLVTSISQVPFLDDLHPAMTFQASCSNAYPEIDQNLAYVLLRHGAISTISATRVSWYWVGESYYVNSCSNAGMAYAYADRMTTQGMTTGRALHDLKQEIYPHIWMNWTVFNVYGDPSLALTTVGPVSNDVENGDFEEGTAPWQWHTNGKGTFTTRPNPYNGGWSAELQIDRAGTNVQLYQRNIHLEPKQHYRLHFAARSSNGQDLKVYLHNHTDPYTNYGLNGVLAKLDTEWQEFDFEFTTKNFTDPVDDARLRFWLAPYDVDGMTYQIDYVFLQKVIDGVPPLPTPDPVDPSVPHPGHCDVTPGNVILNPGFESGKVSWAFYTNATGTFDIAADSYECAQSGHITIIKPGSNVQLYQKEVTLRPNTSYRLRLAAKSSTGRNVNVFLHKHTADYDNYGLNGVELDLTTEWQVFQLQFTTLNFDTPVHNARLRIWLASDDVKNEQYWFDDIALVPLDEIEAAVFAAAAPQNVVRAPLLEEGEFLDDMDRERIEGGFVGEEPTLINDLVQLAPPVITYDNTPAPNAPAGLHVVSATFQNSGQTSLRDLFFVVTQLTNSNLLINADDGPDGAGAILTVPATSLGENGVLDPGESFTVDFVFGLKKQKAFKFTVDAYGVPLAEATTAALGRTDAHPGFVFELDSELFIDAGVNLYLPLIQNTD